MKPFFRYGTVSISLMIIFVFNACKNGKPIVDAAFVDSLQHIYTCDSLLASNQRNMDFWSGRIDSLRPGNINEMQYAATLVNRFKLAGNLQDLDKADVILKQVDATFAHTLAAPLLNLVSLSIMHHRFATADTFYQKACKIGVKAYQRNALGFDVNFELGKYEQAAGVLRNKDYIRDYNYFFRRSKLDHLNGEPDSAFSAMQQAVALAGKNPYLQNLAWSMLGDLAVHQKKLATAANDLKQAIRFNPGDMHSLLQLGWVALVQDNDTANANALFNLAVSRNKLPDPYYKMYQMAQWQHDENKIIYYANRFVKEASLPEYELMYDKYLIELYATVLNRPQNAVDVAFAELKNRATPQTYAWYAYSLLCNHQQEKAYQVFQQHIAGKPLEGIELYYVGKVLNSIRHGFDAAKCFEAAMQNKYDLSPYMIEDMEKML